MEKFQKNAKYITTRSLTVVLFIVFGIIISAQFRSIPTRISNPIAPYASLKETKESLYNEQLDIKKEIVRLHQEIQNYQNQSENAVLTEKQLSDLQNKKAEAGLTKLTGPGITVTLDDSKNNLANEDSIIHAADLRDIINTSWGAGAEAISINNQRIVISTAVDCIVNTILINNVRLSVPFKINVIGDKAQLRDTLENSFYLSALRSRHEKNGITFKIEENNNILMPIFDGSFEIKGEN